MTNSLPTKPVIVRENLTTTVPTFTRKYGNKHLIRPLRFSQQTDRN